MVLCCGMALVWFRSLLMGPSQVVICQCLILSGDVERNPGPLDDDKNVEEALKTVDDTTLEISDWNIIVLECQSLAAKWEQLSIYLGLTYEVIDNIKGSGDNHHCWNEALKQWIKQNYDTEMFGVPTWRSLLAAVAKVDKLKFSKLVSEHLIQVKETHQTEAKDAKDNYTGSIRTDPIATKLDADPSIPIPPSINLNPEKKQQHYEIVSSTTQEMIYKFQVLFSTTRKSLREEKVSVSELVHHLECLGFIKPIFKDAGLSPLRHQLPKLANSETVDDVMSIIKDYCSFFNYQMLKHIIDEFGTLHDKENLAAYTKDFEAYAECCVIDKPQEMGEMCKEGSIMIVILDDSFESCTLSHLHVFIADLRKVLNISSDVVLRLCYINRGSIKLTFQLPHYVQHHVFPLSSEQEASLFELGVVELSCGDYHFTRQENKELVDACATGEVRDSTECVAKLVSLPIGLTLDLRVPGDTVSITNSPLELRGSDTAGTTAIEIIESEPIQDTSNLDDPDTGTGHNSILRKLYMASKRGDIQVVKRLTEESNLNPLQADKYGRNALHYAARGGQLDVMKYLTEELGHNPASQISTGRLTGWTPLHIAAQFNHLELVQYLIAEQKVDPMYQAKDGDMPLHKACTGDNIDVIVYLVDAMRKYLPLEEIASCRGQAEQCPLHIAALYGRLEIVEYLASELNCDPNIIILPSKNHERSIKLGGRTPLHNAAQNGHLNVVKFLIENQHCNTSPLDYDNVTPLHMAAQFGHLDTVRYLTLEQHCDPLCTSAKNNTPLHFSVMYGQIQVIEFFIEALHCPPDIRGWFNMTPLDMARSHGHRHVVRYLKSVINPKFYQRILRCVKSKTK